MEAKMLYEICIGYASYETSDLIEVPQMTNPARLCPDPAEEDIPAGQDQQCW